MAESESDSNFIEGKEEVLTDDESVTVTRVREEIDIERVKKEISLQEDKIFISGKIIELMFGKERLERYYSEIDHFSFEQVDGWEVLDNGELVPCDFLGDPIPYPNLRLIVLRSTI